MNEQISCGIAQDLMPLVIDDACGEDSRRAVENHIAGCEECAKVYEAMKAEMPKPAADENENAHFQKSMKKTRRKTRWIKILCVVLAAILLVTAGYFAANPRALFAEYTTAPVSWFHDAQLVRTTDGHLLLQFTPDGRYKRYMGVCTSWTELPDMRSVDLSFNYSKLARILNVEPVVDEQWYIGEYAMPDGKMYVALGSAFVDWIYADGKARPAAWRELTDAEREKLTPPESITGERAYSIYDYVPESEYGGKLELRIVDERDSIIVYDGTQEIPLCDPELEEMINVRYPSIGEVRDFNAGP